MGAIKKAKFNVDNGTDFDTYHFETSSEQVKNKIVSLDDLDLVTEEGFLVDALAVKELNSKSSGTITSVGMNTQYCSVRKSGGVGVIDINGNLKNAIGKWQEVTLFTSSILPKWTCSGVVTDQNGHTGDITFNTSGEVILAARNKDVSDTWYRGQIVFVTN